LKNAYRNLAKEYHPDRPNGSAEMFELITHAYNVLSNPKKREEFDTLFTISKQSESDHFTLKKQAEQYSKSKLNKIKNPETAKKEFSKAMMEMDRKRNYKRGVDNNAIPSKDADRLFRDLSLVREQEDIENTHDNLFEDCRFDVGKFNAAFDEMHGSITDIVPHSGNPSAYNSIDVYQVASYGNVDNYDDIFMDDEEAVNTSIYSGLDTKQVKRKLTKAEIGTIKQASYTKGHKDIDKDYESKLSQRMQEYKSYGDSLENRKISDYKKYNHDEDGCGGYGITHQLGIGTDTTLFNDESDIKTRYNKLLQQRSRG
jgi:curved DNA-binding protein CbpA